MGHRHLPNSLPVLRGQSQNSYDPSSEHPYTGTGRVVGLENGSLAYPIDTVSRGGIQRASHWNSERMRNDYRPSSFTMGVPNIQPALSGSSHDPSPHSSDPGSSHLPQEGSTSFSQSYYYDRCYGYESELSSGSNIARRQLKRSPEISVACERGSTTRFPVAESSSSYSAQPLERPTSNYQDNPYDPIDFPRDRGAAHLSAGEGSSRNVRRRTTLDPLTNPQPTQLSGYSSHYHQTSSVSTYPHEGGAPTNMVAGWNNRQWNVDALAPASHARMHTSGSGGSRNESTRLLPRGDGREIHGAGPVSSRDYNSSVYLYESPFQVAAESYANHHQREMPNYSAALSYSNLGGEVAPRPSVGNSLPSHLVAETYPSGQLRPSGGWRHNHRTGRSRITTERFRAFSGIADSYSRNGSQNFDMMMDYSAFYASSRDVFDQYEEMRLDVDNMSYEELIALGERIGSVNTGVSEDMISNCLAHSSYQNHKEESCAICLEEYGGGEEMVGTLKKCGHSYHVECIRQWLSMKNVCPICKAPALLIEE